MMFHGSLSQGRNKDYRSSGDATSTARAADVAQVICRASQGDP
jgi:hypothetical protein